MSIKRSVIAAIAALAFALPANADPGSTITKAPASPSTFTVLAHGGFGGMHGGFAMGGGGFGGPHMGFGGPHMGGFGPHFGPGGHFGFGHRAFFHGGHPAFFHHHHGFFRHGHFFPLGVGFYGYGYGDGGSCYWNCRASGFGPGYCSAYAYNFCY